MDEVKLKPGWLKRQFDKVAKDVKSWPLWMRREAGLLDRPKRKRKQKKGR